MLTMKGIYFEGTKAVYREDLPVPVPSDTQSLIRIMYAAVSYTHLNTDILAVMCISAFYIHIRTSEAYGLHRHKHLRNLVFNFFRQLSFINFL